MGHVKLFAETIVKIDISSIYITMLYQCYISLKYMY